MENSIEGGSAPALVIYSRCDRCRNSGVIMGYSARYDDLGSDYAFRCRCAAGTQGRFATFPEWRDDGEFVECSRDRPLTVDWIRARLASGETRSEEFCRRVGIWGRPIFEEVYRRLKRAQDQKPMKPKG